MNNYDLIVIGSGPGGYVTAIRAAQLGLKTALVEKESLGGVCLNWGCIPTKALLKSANLYQQVNKAAEYGISVAGVSVDFAAMVKRSKEVAGKMSQGVNLLMKKNNIDVIAGTGMLKRNQLVEVTDHQGRKQDYAAKHIIIATGARSRALPNLPQDGVKVIGYRQALSLEQLPKSIMIVGSGAIGVEFAYLYNTLGVEVTLIEALPQITPLEDKDVAKQLERSLKQQGVDILTNVSISDLDTSGSGCRLTVTSKSGTDTIDSDLILSAVGIEANIDNLGLDKVGITTSAGRIVVDEAYATNVPGYYAIGDCIPGPALAHVASFEGIACVERIAGKTVEAIDYNNIPACIYASPEVASVGYTEAKAREAGLDIKVGKFPFAASGKATAGGSTEGFVKLLFDAVTGELLGAHMIGANVTELAAEIVALRKLETTGEELINTIHPHPTVSEAIMEAAADAYGEAIHL